MCAAAMASVLAVTTTAHATPVTNRRTITGVDWTSAGLGGLGNGSGSLTIAGVTGPVVKAYLYWHGIDGSAVGAGDGVYDNEVVTFAGSAVTGVALGDATTNCWGSGSSRAFRADVTELVTGNGSYAVSDFAAKPGHSANGVSLLVVFDDGNAANDRDLVFFEGNDSNIPDNFPGEDPGWHATLADIQYGGGTASAVLFLGDGQIFGDGTLTFSSTTGTLTVPDSDALYDGNSVVDNGTGRAPNGSLWDVHQFDLTTLFSGPGLSTINVDGLESAGDCLGLVLLVLDLEAGAAPCGNGTIDAGEACDPAAPTNACTGGLSCLSNCTCGCSADDQCDDLDPCTLDTCTAGACSNPPREPLPAECSTETTTTTTTSTSSTTLPDGTCAPPPAICPPADLTRAIYCQPGVRCMGTPGDDVICGTPDRDHINALGGDDVVCAGGGNDVVQAGQGNDRVDGAIGCGGETGEPDDDRIKGHGGSDVLRGGAGADRISAGTGDDEVFGEAGDDRLQDIGGSSGGDLLVGGPGHDSANGGQGAADICEAEVERRCELDCQ